jgi:hypothetical protein
MISGQSTALLGSLHSGPQPRTRLTPKKIIKMLKNHIDFFPA